MKIPSIAGALLLAATLAAPVPSLAQTSPGQTGITKDTIRIGMYGPITGPTSIGALALYGAAAIYKNVDAHGGINGRQIKLFIEDGACKPNTVISLVKKLISQDKVFLIHGGWCSDGVMALKPILARHPTLPFIDLAGASGQIVNPILPNVFQPVANGFTVARTMLDFALTVPGAKRIAVITQTDEWGESQVKPLLADMKARHIKPVTVVKLEATDTNATSQVLKIRAAKPDVVIATLYPVPLTLYLRDAYTYGVRVPTVTTQGASVADEVHRVGNRAATDNLYAFYPLAEPMKNPKMAKWIAIFRKYYPHQPVEEISLAGMTGALAVVAALKKAGPDLTREKVIHELDQLRGFDPGIQSGPLTFTPKDHAGITSGEMAYWPASSKEPEVVKSYPAAGK